MEKIRWKVEGMDCSNCALTIRRYLEKEDARNIRVNFVDGDVAFELNGNSSAQQIQKGIDALGYKVTGTLEADAAAVPEKKNEYSFKVHTPLPAFYIGAAFAYAARLDRLALVDGSVDTACTLRSGLCGGNVIFREKRG